MKVKFSEEKQNFLFFREQTKCEYEAKWSRKMQNFGETIFPFRRKPYFCVITRNGIPIGNHIVSAVMLLHDCYFCS